MWQVATSNSFSAFFKAHLNHVSAPGLVDRKFCRAPQRVPLIDFQSVPRSGQKHLSEAAHFVNTSFSQKLLVATQHCLPANSATQAAAALQQHALHQAHSLRAVTNRRSRRLATPTYKHDCTPDTTYSLFTVHRLPSR